MFSLLTTIDIRVCDCLIAALCRAVAASATEILLYWAVNNLITVIMEISVYRLVNV